MTTTVTLFICANLTISGIVTKDRVLKTLRQKFHDCSETDVYLLLKDGSRMVWSELTDEMCDLGDITVVVQQMEHSDSV